MHAHAAIIAANVAAAAAGLCTFSHEEQLRTCRVAVAISVNGIVQMVTHGLG
jgi:hypothetical protein